MSAGTSAIQVPVRSRSSVPATAVLGSATSAGGFGDPPASTSAAMTKARNSAAASSAIRTSDGTRRGLTTRPAITSASMGATGTSAAKARRRRSKPASKRSRSVIAELLPESLEESLEPRAGAGRGHPRRAAQLRGVEACDVTEGEQRAIVGLQLREGVREVEIAGAGRRVGPGHVIGGGDRDLRDAAAPGSPQELSDLVGGDGAQPRPKPVRLAERARAGATRSATRRRPPPRPRPCRRRRRSRRGPCRRDATARSSRTRPRRPGPRAGRVLRRTPGSRRRARWSCLTDARSTPK